MEQHQTLVQKYMILPHGFSELSVLNIHKRKIANLIFRFGTDGYKILVRTEKWLRIAEKTKVKMDCCTEKRMGYFFAQ